MSSMKCPNCNSLKSRVLDTRLKPKLNYIYRRRVCEECSFVFTTRELHIPKEYAKADLEAKRVKHNLNHEIQDMIEKLLIIQKYLGTEELQNEKSNDACEPQKTD